MSDKPSETPWLNVGTRVMPERGVAKVKRVRFAFATDPSEEETSPPPSPSPSTTKAATMSLFGGLGANNKPAGTSNLFGAAGSTPASTQQSTPSLFGTAPTGATGTGASGGLFGAQQQQNNKPTLSLFGNNANTGTSNATAQPATSAPSLFGGASNATQQPATTAPSLFGGASAAPSNSLFGATSNAQPSANTQQSAFGGNNQGEIRIPSVVEVQSLTRMQHSAQAPLLLDNKSRMPDPFTLTT